MVSNDGYRIGFVVEQALGHVTHGQNLHANVPKDPSVEAYWSFPAWDAPGLVGKVPNWTVRAGMQARQAVADMQAQTQLEALFFHTQVTAVLSQNWLRRIPSIVSLDATPRQYDSLGEFYDHNSGPSWLEKWKWRLNRDCFKIARRLVTWSQWASQGLINEYGVPAEKITVIPPGVNCSEWTRPASNPNKSNPVKILFVGANLERKGGLLLLESFRALRQQTVVLADGSRADVELHLVTRDPVPDEAGLFVYNNIQPNSELLKKLYANSDIFALPTYGDCLPMVLSEAGAAGLPLVSTRVAAIPEIVRDGETGFLVPPGNVAALTTVLQRLINNPDLRCLLGTQATRLVRQQYDAEKNTFRLLDLLKQTITETRNICSVRSTA